MRPTRPLRRRSHVEPTDAVGPDRCRLNLSDRRFRSEFISVRPSPTCLGDLAALKLPSAEAVSLIKSGLARERVALDELRDVRRQIAAGIRVARDRDGASYWAIASAIVPGGAGCDPGEVHRARLEMAKRLRQRSR